MSAIAVPAPVGSLLHAVNLQERAAFLETFAEDGVVVDCGRRFEGRQAIGLWSDTELIGDGCLITVFDVDVDVDLDGDAVAVTADVVSMGFNGRTTITFEVRGGLVTLMSLCD